MGIFVDRIQEEVVKELYVSRDVGVQSRLSLELIEELLPLGSKVPGDLNPQAFDPRVVYTP